MDIDANITFQDILRKYRRLTIPFFQRPYSWRKKQINDLWESIIENERGYYLGALVCVKAISGQRGLSLDIIDGQQRLITLSLFITGIRDLLQKDKKSVAQYEDLLYEQSSFKNTPKEARIIFHKDNLNEVYKNILDQKRLGRLDDTQRNLKRNYDIIYSLLSVFAADGGDLNSVKDKIEDLKFHLIRSDDEAEVYQLFEGLNSTALVLAQVDLLKNGIFKYLSLKKKDKVLMEQALESWQEMEAIFEQYNFSLFNRFLRHEWIMRNGYISGSQLYSSIREKYLKSKDTAEIYRYLTSLKRNGSIYVSLRKADPGLFKRKNAGTRAVLELLRRISVLGVDQVYEILLAAHSRYTSGKNFPLKSYTELVEFIFRFVFIAKYSTLSPAQYERIFAHISERIHNSKKSNFFFTEIKPKLKELKSLIIGREDEFVERFIKNCRYGKADPIILFLFQDIIKKDDRRITIKDPEIEHILPQSPQKWGLRKSEIKAHVHKIGNLTLLSQVENGEEAKDEPMKEKVKKVYAKSVFNLNKILAEWEDDFSRDFSTAIDERSEELAKEIYQLYTS